MVRAVLDASAAGWPAIPLLTAANAPPAMATAATGTPAATTTRFTFIGSRGTGGSGKGAPHWEHEFPLSGQA